jgi:replicative DNA helicase
MDDTLIRRVMPSSAETEQAVIGSILMDKDEMMNVADILVPDDFYQSEYRMIYQAMVQINSEGRPVDLVTVHEQLKSMNVPPEVSSLDFMIEVVNSVATSANAKHYAKIVKEKSLLRKVIKVNETIMEECYAGHESADAILEETEKQLFKLLQSRGAEDITPIKDVVMEAINRIEAASKQSGSVTGVPTGFTDLDYRTAGLQPSDMILIAARPSMGKTAFALNLAAHAACKKHITTAIFSLEMSKVQLVNRFLSMESSVSAQNLRTGNLSETEWEKLVEGASIIGNSGLVIDDTPGISISDMRSKCRKIKLEHDDLGLIIIDYIQLMTSNTRSESRQQEVSEISRSLKALARELNVPVVALSQLSRAVEQRPDHRPMLSDLRESGAIEQDADVVMFLYRDEYYKKDTDKPGVAEVIIAKQRNGPVGTVELAWIGDRQRFANLERS